MKLIERFKRWRMKLAIDNLNEQASFFGFSSMTEEEWLAALQRIQPIVKMSGLSIKDASNAFTNLSRKLHAIK